MDLENKLILASVSNRLRYKPTVCPNCFLTFKTSHLKHYHLRHACWFTQFDKTACKDKPCLCPKYFCNKCDCEFATMVEFVFHVKNNCLCLCICSNNQQKEYEFPKNVNPNFDLEKTAVQHHCLYCQKVFFNVESFIEHGLNCDGNLYLFEGTAFEDLLPEEKHPLPFEPKYKCTICQTIFDHLKTYKNHICPMEKYNPPFKSKYKCVLCHVIFNDIEIYKRHSCPNFPPR